MVDKFAMFGAVVLTCVVVLGMWAWYSRARGADLLPIEITQGRSAPVDGDVSKFGRYDDAYMRRRWRRMCQGSARYQAMGEAYDARKPDPCSNAKTWMR